MPGSLSPLLMIAGSGLLQNQGMGVNSTMLGYLNTASGFPSITGLYDIIDRGSETLSESVIESLKKLGASIFPASTNAIPSAYATSLDPIAPDGIYDTGFTGLINNMAVGLMGAGDLSRFAQIYVSAEGYVNQANQFINSNLNAKYISATFGLQNGGMDNVITGAFNQTTQAFVALGQDLVNLGNLIDMNNLANLGEPSALVRQLASIGGITNSVEATLRSIGVDSDTIYESIASGNFFTLDAKTNKALYEGMTKITGKDLAQIKSVLGVKVDNIATMADLLNPKKLFPNSYKTLTTPTPDGLIGVYLPDGSINLNLEKYFLDANALVYIDDNAIVRARTGKSSISSKVPMI